MSCGVGCRRNSDLVLLQLWRRLAAVALICPLAWEPPYAMSIALKSKKKKKANCHSASLEKFPLKIKQILIRLSIQLL